jgi:heme/copper-type cytochrome/quinol oxidase subunit 2
VSHGLVRRQRILETTGSGTAAMTDVEIAWTVIGTAIVAALVLFIDSKMNQLVHFDSRLFWRVA